MKKFLLISLLIITILISVKTYGQQDSQYTQYMYNTTAVNPAYTGSRGVLSILGLYRTQWLGLEGAPNTQGITAHSPINEKNRLGLGITIINDALGPAKETNFNASASYTIPISAKSKLSFGLNAGANILNVDIVSLRKFDIDDPLTLNNIDQRFSPILGAGLYVRSDNYYVGISAPNVLETEHFDKSRLSETAIRDNFLTKERINYYLIAGYVFEIAPLIKAKPALLTKYVDGAPFQIDLSANVLFYDKFTLGASYRLSKAISALASFNISESLMVGFSYDQELTQLGNFSYAKGSYELILRFELKKIYKKGLTPRFF